MGYKILEVEEKKTQVDVLVEFDGKGGHAAAKHHFGIGKPITREQILDMLKEVDATVKPVDKEQDPDITSLKGESH